MRSNNGHLAYGTSGNPQETLEQNMLAAIAEENERKLKSVVSPPMIDETLIAELKSKGTKFNRTSMIFIARDQTGQIVWLEKGNASAGLEHIVARGHDEQIAKAFNISKSEITSYLRKVISYGIVVSNELKSIGSHTGYQRTYYYEGQYCVIAGIGTNGFIVSAYPRKYKKGL